MRKLLAISSLLAFVGLAAPITASATSLTGTLTTGGTTLCTGGSSLPCSMTSTDSTFAVLRYVFDTPTLFGNLASLSYGYDVILGGIGGGAPRVAIVFSDTTFLEINWGPAGSFSNPALGTGNTGNLLSLTDLGRYDLTGVGGSFYSDRASALALAGTKTVDRASLILDSYGGNDRGFVITEISASDNNEGVTSAVPEPGSMLLLGTGVVAFMFARRRRG